MADKDLDKPENKGLKATAGRWFGPDSSGRNFGGHVGSGILRGLRWGTPENKALNYMMPFAATMLVTEIIALSSGGPVHDVTVPADTAMQVRTQADADGYNAVRFEYRDVLLTHTGDGYRLFTAVAPDGKPDGPDTRFDPVERQVEAWQIVSSIAQEYTRMAEAMAGNVAQTPDHIPQVLQFERISPVYQQDQKSFRVGDNLIPAQPGAQFTLGDARAAAAFWTQTATAIAAGQYAIGDGQGIEGGPNLNDSKIGEKMQQWGSLVLMGYAGCAGLGLLGGAVAGVASSRRRSRQTTFKKA